MTTQGEESCSITFGTDGWRAIIAEDFSFKNVRLVTTAIAHVFKLRKEAHESRLVVGYDTRFMADKFALAAAEVFAAEGFEVILSSTHVPTPAVCHHIASDPHACGGISITASHNPSEYLGIKVRMADGGASPVDFTAVIEEELSALSGRDFCTAPSSGASRIYPVDFKPDYFEALLSQVEVKSIMRYTATNPQFKVLVDPLYGAGREFLAPLLKKVGVDVSEIHCHNNPGFNGLHPEPIPPWTNKAAKEVQERGCTAAFVTDGDADRLGALDSEGNFVSPHKILALVTWHLNEHRGLRGRVVKTLSTSVGVDRLAEKLDLEVTTTPIGFKWIYNEMLKGDVLIGGEESGGIGIPNHVKERDALLMALLLVEMMVVRKKSLGELVSDLDTLVGCMHYTRHDLKVSASTLKSFLNVMPTLEPDEVAGNKVLKIDRRDGIKFHFADDRWLLLRPSGTEPLVRVYAECEQADKLPSLIEAGIGLVEQQTIRSR